jgi:hypothetical protein
LDCWAWAGAAASDIDKVAAAARTDGSGNARFMVASACIYEIV